MPDDLATRMGIELPEGWPPLPDDAGSIAGTTRDPYPVLARRRREEPVELRRRLAFGDAPEELDPSDPDVSYWVYRYDAVNTIYRDNLTFSSSVIKERMGSVLGEHVMLGLDDPEHRRHRNLVAEAFRLKTLGLWESERVMPVIDEMIDRFAARGFAELVTELTYRVPIQVIADILGLPRADHARFQLLAMRLFSAATDPVGASGASQELRAYFAQRCEISRASPGTDVISELVHTEIDGERLDPEELLSFLLLLLPAGAETTYRSTGSLLFGLLTHPGQMHALAADPALLPAAVEEGIRWESPLLITTRRATADTELEGVAIPKGAVVTASIASANHDESRWGWTAENFDLFRDPLPHIGFGAGIHMCLGIHLARMEMRCMVGRLLERLPGLRLDEDRAEELDAHIAGDVYRSPTCLPVLWDT